MANSNPTTNPNQGALSGITENAKLVWRLLNDGRVPFLTKLIIPAVILYVVSPFDIIFDFVPGVGQLDDLAVIFFGVKFFIDMCPHNVVEEHRQALRGEAARSGGDYVDATYRVVDDEKK